MSSGTEILRATIFHTPRNAFRDESALEAFEDGALLIENGRIGAFGNYTDIAGAHPDVAVRDLRGGFLLPGFIDTHVHYPQVRVLGGLGLSLLEWLDRYTLPEEAKLADADYARTIAAEFCSALLAHGTTTALVFGSHFLDATATLFDAGATCGLRIVSGLVLSDRMLRSELHQEPARAYAESVELINRYHGRGRLLYAVTPRFALSCSEAMLDVCRRLLEDKPGIRFQTHLNENPKEISEVARAFPGSEHYFGVYERFGLAGTNAVYAHNVHPTPVQLARMAASQCTVSHCPCSNAALGSGVFPMRAHLDAGVAFGLGTDVGGGTGFGMMKEALQAYLIQRLAPGGFLLNPAHMLYLSTLAGASALGLEQQTGDFSRGKAADVVYLRPRPGTPLASIVKSTADLDRILSAIFTLAGAESVAHVWIGGDCVFRNNHDD